MDAEQPASGSAPSVEDRLAAYFNPPAPEAAPEPEAPQAEGEQVADEQPEDDGLDDFEIDGTSYRVPKDLKAKVSEWKDGALRREDYTRKTQELAALTANVNTMAEVATLRAKFDEYVAPKKSELSEIKAKLAEFKKLDWNALDSDVISRLNVQMGNLKERASEIESAIKGDEQQFGQFAQAKRQEMIQQGQKYLQQVIPGYNAEAMKAATEAALSAGYTPKEVESVLDPRYVHLAFKAAQWDKLQALKTQAVSSAQKAPPVVKPGVSSPNPAAAKDKGLRDKLRKSGDVRDFAALLARRMG
jgi:hypothetical protein